MYLKRRLECPGCRRPILHRLTEGTDFICDHCKRQYHVITEADNGRVALIRAQVEREVLPLNLPRGSVRALVALILSGAAWWLVARDQPLPSALLSLILTVIAYYFGFRTMMPGGKAQISDPSNLPDRPLYLPEGMIRKMLVLGFLIAAVVLHYRGQLAGRSLHAEFFLILAGLIVGHWFKGLFRRSRHSWLYPAGNHLLALMVIGAALWLALNFTQVVTADWHVRTTRALSMVIGFYFGSRS